MIKTTPRPHQAEAIEAALSRGARTRLRFFRLIRLNPETQCWNWQGKANARGYGVINDGAQTWGVHRYAYYLFFKVSPGDLFVCHHCDNPSCVNPGHLFLGTHQENMDDMKAKGRRPIGSARAQSKLTEADIEEIRASPFSNAELAERFGVERSTIEHILAGRRWKHLTGGERIKKRAPHLKLTEDDVRAIRASTMPVKEASQKWGVAESLISRIRHRTRWAHVK